MDGKLVLFAVAAVALALLGGVAAMLVVDPKPSTRTIEKVIPDARLAR